MDSATDRELEVIRAQTRETRANLADKLEALEGQISQTVAGVTSAVETVTQSVTGVTSAVENVAGTVSNTVSNVTESVTGAVGQVARSLDVSSKIQEMPWTAVGCALAAGFAGGYASGGGRRATAAPPGPQAQSWAEPNGSASYQAYRNPPAPAEPGVTSHVTDTVSEIGGAVQSLGISALMGLVTHLARKALPETLHNDVCGSLDKLKTRLGGHHNVSADLFEPKTSNGR